MTEEQPPGGFKTPHQALNGAVFREEWELPSLFCLLCYLAKEGGRRERKAADNQSRLADVGQRKPQEC